MWENIIIIIFLETREKDHNFVIIIVLFREELDLVWFFQNQ